MTIREKVARATWAKVNNALEDHWDSIGQGIKDIFRWTTTLAITAFLEAAAEQGWHMRPDEADPEMYDAGEAALDVKNGHVGDAYRAMVAVAAEFEWDK